MNRTLAFLAVFFALIFYAQSQNLSQIYLDGLYIGPFARTLGEISEKHRVTFSYAPALIESFRTDDRPFKKPLDEQLNSWCKRYKLRWYQGQDGVVYLIDRFATPEMDIPTATLNANGIVEPTQFNLTISGKVVDRQNGEVLPYASVRVVGGAIGTVTNASGFFTLLNILADTTTLEASFLGYAKTRFRLQPGMEFSTLKIDLKPSEYSLSEVVISAEKEELLKTGSELGVVQMTPRKLADLPSIGEKDIMRAFQLLPGISAANEGSSGLYVRGGTPDQNLILYDGFTIYHVDHLYGFFSAFNSNGIKDVQLYKGGFESRFGGRLSSVMEITGKDGNAKGFNIGGDISLLSVNAYAELPIGDKFTSLIAFRRSYKGPLYNKIFDQYNTTETTSQPGGGGGPTGFNLQSKVTSYFYDLNGKFTYRLNKNDAISLSIFNGTDKLDNGTKIETPSFLASQGINFNFEITDLTRYGNVGVGLKWTRKWSDRLFGTTVLSYSQYYSLRDRTNEGTISTDGSDSETFKFGTIEENNLLDYSLKSDYSFQLSSQHKLGFGVFGTYYDIAYTYSQNDTSTILDRQDQGLLAGVYLQDHIKLADGRIKIAPGVRVNYYEPTGKLYTEPRLSANIQFTPKIKLSGSWGRFYQFANRVTREDILSGSRDFWILSDGDQIPVSYATHYMAGLQYENSDFLMSVEGYYKDIVGLSEYSLRFNASFQGVNYEENFYSGIGYAKGLEFLLQKKSGKLSGWVSYTLAQTRSKYDVYGVDYFPANQDVTHEFKFTSLYKWRDWSFSSTWVYATGRPYTAPEGGYSLTLLDGTTSDYFSVGAKNGLRLNDYHRLDIAATRTLNHPTRNAELGSISFSIFNLYNRRNDWYKEYQIVNSDIVENSKTYLGITPNVTLTLKIR